MTPTRFSPRPLADYGFSANSGIFNTDEDAWNLAYLSWDFESRQAWPDPNFSSHVRRTLQFAYSTGGIDLTNSLPIRDTVRGLVVSPPPRAAHLILSLPRLKETQLYQAYGQYWTDTVLQRAKAWRDPAVTLTDVSDFTQALEILTKLK